MTVGTVTCLELAEAIRAVGRPDAALHYWWPDGVSNPLVPWLDQVIVCDDFVLLHSPSYPEDDVLPAPVERAGEICERLATHGSMPVVVWFGPPDEFSSRDQPSWLMGLTTTVDHQTIDSCHPDCRDWAGDVQEWITLECTGAPAT